MLHCMLILRTRLNRYMFIMALLLILAACSDIQKMEIETVLDARNSAVSAGNINAYSRLLMKSYKDGDQDKFDVVSKMLRLFRQFDAMEMKTFNRTIRILDDSHAQCEQIYHLRVKADNTWREMNQREQILLTRTPAGWQISGGL